MSFMQQQIEFGRWYVVETDNGTVFLPHDVVGSTELSDYCEGEIQSITTRKGWGARLSAPGYMDCTEWTVFDTKKEALDFLNDD